VAGVPDTRWFDSPVQRFNRAFARAHHAVVTRTHGRPGHLTPRMRTLVLVTVGRRSGRQRLATLVYVAHGGGFLVLATNFGRPHDPGWWHNLRAAPDAEVWLSGRTMAVHGRELAGAERDAALAVALAGNAQWRTYFAHVTRPIPVILLEPPTGEA